ncbi:hypothetical protein B0H14DRAFT_3667343 [Mycena olivaceomarginata]|nr:hypothetical protein B0H14DRAFT_3667343 [Mycena olivaceomarginata]
MPDHARIVRNSASLSKPRWFPARQRAQTLSALIALNIVGSFLLSTHSHPQLLAPSIPFLSTGKEEVYGQCLQGAVQLRTQTFDGAPHEMGDSWYDNFYTLEAYLLENFPDIRRGTGVGVEKWTVKYARTIILAYVFDKEGDGVRSARVIARRSRIVSTKTGVITDYFGQTWVAPATSAAHRDLHPLRSRCCGRGSSAASYPVAGEPVFNLCNLLAEYGKIDDHLKQALSDERTWSAAAEILVEQSPGRLTTTQAVDIVRGDVKVNALPGEARAIVNHRVAVDDFAGSRTIHQAPYGGGCEFPPQYSRVFAGTSLCISFLTLASISTTSHRLCIISHLWPDAIATLYLSTGGTDTRAYLNLTHAVYRFAGIKDTQWVNMHTVDERLHNGHISSIEWIHAFIQNADGFREGSGEEE